jgi:hypothetical protein
MRRANCFRVVSDRKILHLCCLASLFIPLTAATALLAQSDATTNAPAVSDGQHDFDFDIGTWKTHVSRLQHPLTGSNSWTEYEGTTVVSKVWNGRANLAELEADGSAGHLEVLSLRLYNPQSHQWSLNTASSRSGTISVPTIGEFRNGRGEFFDTEPFGGRNILVRNLWSSITPNSCRFEQSFSADGGKTWEVNWVAIDTRIPGSAGGDKPVAPQSSPGSPDGQHDFDAAFGTWKAHLSRLVHPLTGSTKWVTYDGTSVVRKVWNGRANLEEFEADGTTGHIEGMTLRLYDPQARQWNQVWATSNDGTLGQPMVGEFKDGRGEFYDQEPLNGRAIFVRWFQAFPSPNACHFEQSFSKDGGNTWEVNWVNVYTRVGNDADHTH